MSLATTSESLDRFGNLTPGTTMYPKLVQPNTDLLLPDAWLKWYDISLEGVDLAELGNEARAFLEAESLAGRLVLENALGFLELHHCTSVAFLLVFTWKNDNELWQTGFLKDLEGRSGPGFERILLDVAGHRPMLCVWELAPVWHEREAWARYLATNRDVTAKQRYLDDRCSGIC